MGIIKFKFGMGMRMTQRSIHDHNRCMYSVHFLLVLSTYLFLRLTTTCMNRGDFDVPTACYALDISQGLLL